MSWTCTGYEIYVCVRLNYLFEHVSKNNCMNRLKAKCDMNKKKRRVSLDGKIEKCAGIYI